MSNEGAPRERKWSRLGRHIKCAAVWTVIGNYDVTAGIEPRWSVLGLLGRDRAAVHFDRLDEAGRARRHGAGVRYLIARKAGLAIGADIARGNEETILYLAFGNSWGR